MALQNSDQNIQGEMMYEQVFDKNMRFVGDFDGLYRTERIPWAQDGRDERLSDYYRKSRFGVSELLSSLQGNVTEVGCGLGYALNYWSMRSDKRLRGVDISHYAVSSAKETFPHLSFDVADVTKDVIKDDIVILNECLWYILHDINSVPNKIQSKYLIINNAFLREQKYGRDVIDGWDGLIWFVVSRGFTVLSAKYEHDGKPLMNGLLLCTRDAGVLRG